jgi:hypothetical protein
MKQRQEIVHTTLGELIVAVTDEVQLFIHDPSDVYTVTSYVVNDLLSRYQLHADKQSLRVRSSCFQKRRPAA